MRVGRTTNYNSYHILCFTESTYTYKYPKAYRLLWTSICHVEKNRFFFIACSLRDPLLPVYKTSQSAYEIIHVFIQYVTKSLKGNCNGTVTTAISTTVSNVCIMQPCGSQTVYYEYNIVLNKHRSRSRPIGKIHRVFLIGEIPHRRCSKRSRIILDKNEKVRDC